MNIFILLQEIVFENIHLKVLGTHHAFLQYHPVFQCRLQCNTPVGYFIFFSCAFNQTRQRGRLKSNFWTFSIPVYGLDIKTCIYEYRNAEAKCDVNGSLCQRIK